MASSPPGSDAHVFAPNGRSYGRPTVSPHFNQDPNPGRLQFDGTSPRDVVMETATAASPVEAERMGASRSSGSNSGSDSSRSSSSNSTASQRQGSAHLNSTTREEILRKLKRESVRLRTFQTWTSNVITPAALARVGFFYFNDRDRVQCAFCLGIVERWEPTDDPSREHSRLFPRCPFVMGLPVGNVPLDPITGREIRPVPTLQLRGGFDVTGIRGREVRPTAEPERGYGVVVLPGHQLRDLGVYKRTPAVMPVFMTLDSRIKSFKSWPRGLAQRPFELAEAGLYYTGVSDEVKCFQCDGGLRGWEPNDDPWVEHAKFYPTCEHVNLIKGADWVNSVKERYELSTDATARQAKAEELMAQEPALSALGNGLDAGDVKRALLVQLEKHGRGFSDLNTLMRAAHNYAQERDDYGPLVRESHMNDSDMESGYGSQEIPSSVSKSASQESVEESQMQEVPVMEDEQPAAGASSAAVPETIKDEVLADIPEEAASDASGTEEKPDLMCKICMDNKVEVVILPCGHLCACMQCSTCQMSDSCPICRQKVAGYVRVYLS